MNAVSNLDKHIRNGCLSSIPPSGGTNSNERFHRNLNNIIQHNRIGILLAYALLSVIIYAHNNTSTESGKIIVKPVT